MKKKKWKIAAIFLLVLFLGIFVFLFSLGKDFFQVRVSRNNQVNIELGEELIFHFSQPMKNEDFIKRIRIKPKIEATAGWRNNFRQLVIKPKEKWEMEKKYEISLPEGKSFLFFPFHEQKFSFFTPKYPRVEKFFPERGTYDVVLDIEDPLAVDFNQTLENFDIKFSIIPETKIVYRENGKTNRKEALPEIPLLLGERYEVRVLVKNKEESENKFKEIYFSYFETLPPPPEKWENDFNLRLNQAKRFTRAKIQTGKYIDVNLTSQILSIFENGKIIETFLISSGQKGMDTPKGEFSIHNKADRAWSKKYELWMPFWMAIVTDGSFGIHELPEWPGGYKEGANHLGTPVSHGCIRLGIGAAERVFNFSEIGTPVVIY